MWRRWHLIRSIWPIAVPMMWYLSNLFTLPSIQWFILVAKRFINCNRLASQELCHQSLGETRVQTQHQNFCFSISIYAACVCQSWWGMFNRRLSSLAADCRRQFRFPRQGCRAPPDLERPQPMCQAFIIFPLWNSRVEMDQSSMMQMERTLAYFDLSLDAVFESL